MFTWWGDSKNMEEIESSRWLFEGRLRQGKNVLPDGLNWLCYFAGSSKKPWWKFNFFHIFGILLSSRHEKRCQILQTLFWVFQYSRNSQCVYLKISRRSFPHAMKEKITKYVGQFLNAFLQYVQGSLVQGLFNK
jgi:hypothetical protein